MKKKNTSMSLLLVGGIVLALLIVFTMILDSVDKPVFSAGHEALVKQDCTSAIEAFDQVIAKPRLLDTGLLRYNALREKDQCQQFQKASELDGSGALSDAAAAYYKLINEYPKSDLVATARTRLNDILITPVSIANMGSENFCTQLVDVGTSHVLEDEQVNIAYPKVVDACARYYEANGDLITAAGWYDAFLKDFKTHNWSDTFRTALANDLINYAAGNTPGWLDAPYLVGNGIGSTFTLTYFNDSPEPVRLILNGPTTNIIELPACKDCQKLSNPPSPCEGKGKSAKLTLPTGSYQALIVAGKSGNTLNYLNTWQMNTGTFEGCFYILQ